MIDYLLYLAVSSACQVGETFQYVIFAFGEELEEPFNTASNSLPLTALGRSIERDFREAMGETDFPEPLQPVDFCLL